MRSPILSITNILSILALSITCFALTISWWQWRLSLQQTVPLLTVYNDFRGGTSLDDPSDHILILLSTNNSIRPLEAQNYATLLVIFNHKNGSVPVEFIIDDYFHFCLPDPHPDTPEVFICSGENNLRKLFNLEEELRAFDQKLLGWDFHVAGNRNYTYARIETISGHQHEEFLISSLQGQIFGEDGKTGFRHLDRLERTFPPLSLSMPASEVIDILSRTAELLQLSTE